ncbi:MAG TPA: S16 family serine protease [Acidimicrobiales bacterium]|jgi:PDZ domain-containing protein|nr:S16 family serine protease [Acidimicrobiales bacterium]
MVPSPGVARRGRRWPWVIAGFVALLLLAGFVASRQSINYYVITPGNATPVAQYIEVPSTDNHPVTGNILLTDVFVSQLNALSYLQYRFFDSNDEIYSSQTLLGPSNSQAEFTDQGYLEMTQAQSFATAAALSHLGYTVNSTNVGALVYGVVPGSPAAKTLHVAQVITAVNGTPTTSECGLIQALHGYSAGTTVTLSVEQSSINEFGSFVNGPVKQKTITLARAPKGPPVTFCPGPPITQTSFIGVEAETQQDWQFPVKVTVHTQNIGGPSAGLAMTLGIIDKLSSGRLTGGHIVAATGTIDQYGNVGDVGGVAEKTIAVEQAGATVFFVPKVELKTAEAKASPQLHVYAVSNLDQVLRILKGLGGNVNTDPVPAQAAP